MKFLAVNPKCPLSTQGGQVLATFDPTLLSNGSYIVQLSATNAATGAAQDSGILVTVVGDYKPGRVRFDTTDLTVPLTGLPITVGRVYDSLERTTVGDFGYGWSLAIGNPRLEVSPGNHVTLTQPNGERVTFFFTPRPAAGAFGFLQYPAYTPEAGVYGSLRANGCPLVVAATGGSGWLCFLAKPQYAPTNYTYTDPSGSVFVYTAEGALQAITDLNGNTLRFTPDGILSSTGRGVVFGRDAQGRIETITDPAGNVYRYGYDGNGDLQTVTFPAVAVDGAPEPVSAVLEYFYAATHPHLYEGEADPLQRTREVATYHADGRLATMTRWRDATTAFTTSYTYDLANQTSTTTNPDGGQVVRAYATRAVPQGSQTGTATDLVRETVAVRPDGQGGVATSTTTYATDDQRNVVAIGLPDPITGAAAPLATDPVACAPRNLCATYDAAGNRTRVTQMIAGAAATTAIPSNAFGQVTRITDPLGSGARLSYTPAGGLEAVHDSAGDQVGGSTYDAQGNLQSIYLGDDPTQATTYTADLYGHVRTERDPLGNRTTFSNYDIFGNPHTIVREIVTTHPTSQGSTAAGALPPTATGAPARLPGHALFHPLLPNPSGGSLTYTYDAAYNALGQRTQATVQDTDGTTHTTHFAYDPAGNLVRQWDAASGWYVAATYYRDGLLNQMTWTDGSTVDYTYTWRGDIETITDEAGTVTRFGYDLAGNLVTVTEAEGAPASPTTTYGYDLAGRRVRYQDARGHTTTLEYDDADRLQYVRDPINGATHPIAYAYDAVGQVDWMLGVTGVKTDYGYDNRGVRTSVTYNADDPGTARTETQQQNGVGAITASTDWNNVTTTFGYDVTRRRLTTVRDGLGHTTRYALDGFGNTRVVTDAEGHATSFRYDVLQRLTQKTWPDGSNERFTYHYRVPIDTNPANDQVPTPATPPFSVLLRVDHTLPDGNQNRHYLNALGQLVRSTSFDGAMETYTYGPTGQLTRATRAHDGTQQTTCYAYDRLDRLIETREIGSATDCATALAVQRVSYAYDANGNRTALTTEVGTEQRASYYAYDALDRLCVLSTSSPPTSCADTSGNYAFAYQDHVSDPAISRIETTTYPNGMVEMAQFDPFDELTVLEQQDAAGNQLGRLVYTPLQRENGVLTQRLDEGDNAATTIWRYDAAYRLTSEARTDHDPMANPTASWHTHYTYDKVGNRLTQAEEDAQGTLQTTQYHYNSLDQIEQLVLPDGTEIPYIYDGRGNLTSDGGATYAYDAADQLTGVTAGSTSYTYGYDALGQLARQQKNGSATRNFLWDVPGLTGYGDIVAEYDAAGTLQASYVLDQAGVVAQEVGAETDYLLRDRLSSVLGLVDAQSGDLEQEYRYAAFGEPRIGPSTAETAYRFTGERYMPETGLTYLRARWYHPASGRFLTRDPFAGYAEVPASQHRYCYTHNNPVNLTDPSGMTALVGYSARNKQNSAATPAVREAGWRTRCVYAATESAFEEAFWMILFGGPGAFQLDLIDLGMTCAFEAFKIPDVCGCDFGGFGGGRGKRGRGGRGVSLGAGGTSFSPETPVQTPDGPVPIGAVVVGDAVLGYNEATGTTAPYSVTAVWAHAADTVLVLRLGDEVITSTREHPFLVLLRGWLPAEDLRAGDYVRRADGSYGLVRAVAAVAARQPVVNLTVAQAHTFFVGDDGWLVHNAGPRIVHHPTKRAARRAAFREAGIGANGLCVFAVTALNPGSQSPMGDPGERPIWTNSDDRRLPEGDRRRVHHDPWGHIFGDDIIPPHFGAECGEETTHHTYPSLHDPRRNR